MKTLYESILTGKEKLAQAQEILSKIKTLRSALWNSVGDPYLTTDPHLFYEACEIVIEDIENLLESKLCELEAEFKEL